MAWDALLDLVQVLGLPLALALVGVWALGTGRVIPKTTHEEALKVRDDRIETLEHQNQQLLDLLLPAVRGVEQATTMLREKRRA